MNLQSLGAQMNTKKLFVFVGAALTIAFANVVYSSFSPEENATAEVAKASEISGPEAKFCGAEVADKSCAELADVRGDSKGDLEEYVTPSADEGFAISSDH
jgi:hypothetical protein